MAGKRWLIISVFLLGMGCTVAAGRTIYVDANGPADFNTIQAAIDGSSEGDKVIVAEGSYNENINFTGTNITLTSTDPNDPVVVAGTVICGDGTTSVVIFSGSEDASCELRGFTITGGCVHKPYSGGGIRGNATKATISYCVINANTSEHHGGGLCGCNGLISNCTISGNKAYIGGGLCGCDGPITNCIISENSADHGAGLYGCDGPISNCTVTNNRAAKGAGPGGGGGLIWCDGEISDCTISGNIGAGVLGCSSISNCIIIDNTGYHGGGVSASGSVSNCVIIGNTAYRGGGLAGCTSISNCTITGNTAEFGGGIFCENVSSTITNCTISSNRAKTDGGGIYCWGIDATVSNCILWGDTAPQGDEIALFGYWVCASGDCFFYPSSITFSYSDVQGGATPVYIDSGCTLNWEAGNIDVDPCFADVGYWDPNETLTDPNDDFWVDGDYHLQSAAGRWDPNNQSWVQDANTSQCIDAGDPMSPIGLEPFPNGGIINMGAYGGTPEASKSYFGEPVCETVIAGDINGDCKVNFLDFRIMALHWLEDNTPVSAVTTTYLFQPDPNALVTSGGFAGQGQGSRSIEGRFELTIDFDAGIAWFNNVDATLSEEVWIGHNGEGSIFTDSLDVIFNMTELVSTDVSEAAIDFVFEKNIPSFPLADVHLQVIFLDGSVQLVGSVCDAICDGYCFHLDAVAVAEP